jgi:hypothetical protein
VEYLSRTSHDGFSRPWGTSHYIGFYRCSSSCINSCVCHIYVGIWFAIPWYFPCRERVQVGQEDLALVQVRWPLPSPFAGAVFVSFFFGNNTDNNRNRNHRSWRDKKKNANDDIYGQVALKPREYVRLLESS